MCDIAAPVLTYHLPSVFVWWLAPKSFYVLRTFFSVLRTISMYFVIYVVLRTNYRFWLDIPCISPSIRYRVLAKTWFFNDHFSTIILQWKFRRTFLCRRQCFEADARGICRRCARHIDQNHNIGSKMKKLLNGGSIVSACCNSYDRNKANGRITNFEEHF